LVLVRVGERSEHKVDEKLLRTSSAFFKAALSHEWKESQTHTIELPTVEPENFQIYLDWLHTRRVHVSTSLDPSPEERQQEMDKLVESYVLGDYVQDIDYKDTIMDTIMDWAMDLPPQPAWLDMRPWLIQVWESYPRLQKLLGLIAFGCESLESLKSGRYLNSAMPEVRQFLKNREQKELLDDGNKKYGVRCFEKTCMEDPCLFHSHGDSDCYKKKK
jgi:hypothetical protein